MNIEQAQLIVEHMSDAGYPASIRTNYSGRGMVGTTCVAIVTENPDMVAFYAKEAGLNSTEVPKRRDSMGKYSMVVY